MVRPLSGERPKKHATITIDPELWQTFKKIVELKQPDGDPSASSHIETLVKREVARIQDSNTPDVVNIESLQRQLLHLRKRYNDILRLLENRQGSIERFDKLAKDYHLDFEHFSNVPDVIRNVLQEMEEEGSPVHTFLDGQPESDLALFISMIETNSEIEHTNKKILDAHRKRYLTGQKPSVKAEAEGTPTEEQSLKEEEQKPSYSTRFVPGVEEEAKENGEAPR
jgi:hypothetical protein